MNKLLINADDYGLHPLVNEAISDCVEKGCVNSISVMANSDFVDYRVLREFQQSGVFVGAHLSWVRSRWLTSEYEIFGWREFAWKLLSGGSKFQDALRKEAEAQIQLLISNGISPDHLDSHQHVHHFPMVWQIAEELGNQYGIKRIRCCNVKNNSLRRNGLAGIALQRLAVSYFNPDYHVYVAGIKFPGNYSLERIKNELTASAGANTELIVHPGIESNYLDKLFPDWRFDWKKEYDVLIDNRLPEIISSSGFCFSRRTAFPGQAYWKSPSLSD